MQEYENAFRNRSAYFFAFMSALSRNDNDEFFLYSRIAHAEFCYAKKLYDAYWGNNGN